MISQSGTFSKPSNNQSPLDWLLDQCRIVLALAVRDLRSRFGEEGLGYAASFAAPLAWIAATYLAFAMLGRTSPVYADIITFIISGLIPYAVFRYTVTAFGRVKTTVRGLLLYPTVTEEHAFAAGALVEAANGIILLTIVMALNFLLFGQGEFANPAGFFWGFALCWALGASFAYLFAVLSRFHARAQEFGQILLRPSFFLSAILFTANELPGRFLDILGWNPLLHAIEIARDGMLFHYESRVASPSYLLLWVATLSICAYLVSLMRRT